MALNCEDKLAADIQKDCDNTPVGGIEVNAVIINFDDIDKASSTIDTDDMTITNLATASGTSGFFIEGIKQVNGASSELVIKETSFDKFKHTFTGVVLNPSAANKKSMSNMTKGGRYVIVLEKKWKGTGQVDAFEVLGFESGLYVSEMNWNSNEDDGVIKFTLSSADGYEEAEMQRNLKETDYATTKTAFDAKFATA